MPVPLFESKAVVEKILRKRILEEQHDRILHLWYSLFNDVYANTRSPYAVSHGADHIANVVATLDGLLDFIVPERIHKTPDDFRSVLISLFGAALIHDVGMLHVAIETDEPADYHRNRHARIDVIEAIVGRYMSKETWAEYDDILQIAQAHAGCLSGRNGDQGDYTPDEKIRSIEQLRRFHPYDLLSFVHLLRFADFLDIRFDRLLYLFDSGALSRRQTLHKKRQELVKIDIMKFGIRIRCPSNRNTLPREDMTALIDKATKQFEDARMYFAHGVELETIGWKPEDAADTPFPESITSYEDMESFVDGFGSPALKEEVIKHLKSLLKKQNPGTRHWVYVTLAEIGGRDMQDWMSSLREENAFDQLGINDALGILSQGTQ